jgi:hypothetical protein
MVDTEEVWKDVVGFEGLYQVSNMGRARSLDRVVLSRRLNGDFLVNRKGRVLTLTTDGSGYKCFSACKDGGRLTVFVHVAVAECFIGPRPDGLFVCHNDGIKTNNSAMNLRYDTQKNNIHQAIADGQMKMGEEHPTIKYPIDVIRAIRSGEHRNVDLMRKYGISERQLYRIKYMQQRRSAT